MSPTSPDLILYLKALVMGIVEGLTEFVPVSSTGHLILAGDLLAFNGETVRVFEIVIQTGAMLAIIWEYKVRFVTVLYHALSDRAAQRFVANIAVAFTPAAVFGLLVGKHIQVYLLRPVPIALAFVLGGLVILWTERRRRSISVERIDDMTWRDALGIGFAQCFSLVPGTSRSATTIIGGLVCELSRQAATEFSSFLAVPTLIAAGAYQLYLGRRRERRRASTSRTRAPIPRRPAACEPAREAGSQQPRLGRRRAEGRCAVSA
jgi:undecaprenyl-diphosphatase